MGDRPLGRILYLENGRRRRRWRIRTWFPSSAVDPLDATEEEAGRAWRSYMGYWGTYAVEAAAGVVIHHVEGAWFPNWVGRKQVRGYRFSGDRLTLEADSPDWHATLVWQRTGAAQDE